MSETHKERARRFFRDRSSGEQLAVKQLAAEFKIVEDAILESAVEWVRIHTSGISAPNEEDLQEMREWSRLRLLMPHVAPGDVFEGGGGCAGDECAGCAECEPEE